MFCTNICPRCSKTVMYNCSKRFALGRTWHKLCFTCIVCSRLLEKYDIATHEDEIYCRRCYGKLFSNCPCSPAKPCRDCRGPRIIRERQEKKPAPQIRDRTLPYIWRCSDAISEEAPKPPVKLQPLYMTGTIMDCLKPEPPPLPPPSKPQRFTLQECIEQNLLEVNEIKNKIL